MKSLPPVRARLDELARLKEDLWQPPGHFYSPIPGPADVASALAILDDPPETLPGIDLNIVSQLSFLEAVSEYGKTSVLPERQTPPHRYYSSNVWFPKSDALLTAAILRHLRPQRLVEVGCGFSSAIVLDTNEQHLGGALICTFIDPFPERLKELVHSGDLDACTLIEKRVQQVDLTSFAVLRDRDILLVDSSHVAKLGSDVNHLLFEILPRLAAGVVVHFHDIFYPFEYPKEWVRERRAWNEAYALRAFLQHNDTFEIMFFPDYLRMMHMDVVKKLLPEYVESRGSSLWLRKVR